MRKIKTLILLISLLFWSNANAFDFDTETISEISNWIRTNRKVINLYDIEHDVKISNTFVYYYLCDFSKNHDAVKLGNEIFELREKLVKEDFSYKEASIISNYAFLKSVESSSEFYRIWQIMLILIPEQEREKYKERYEQYKKEGLLKNLEYIFPVSFTYMNGKRVPFNFVK